MTLRDKLRKVLDEIQDSDNHINVIGIVRGYYHEIDVLGYDNLIHEYELDYEALETSFQGLRIFGFDGNPILGNASIPETEPDFLLYQYKPEGEINIDRLIQIIAIVMQHDCTGCCNAIQYINLTESGFMALCHARITHHG